jgi:putative sterol carrier protein
VPLRFGTAEWARELEQSINASSEVRNAAAAWGVGFNGNLLLVFEPDEGSPAGQSLLLRLQGGRCLGAEFVQGDSHPDSGFALRAPLSLWRQILDGKATAATAILTGRMKVEGDKLKLLRYAAAHRAVLACAAGLDTVY